MPPLRGHRLLTGCLLSLLILWTLLGNALVCLAVVRCRHLRSRVTNVFVGSLAASDLLVALLVMPWKAAAEVAGHWPFGAFCDVWVALDIMCSTASILHLCLIGLDRYWAVSSPFGYQRGMRPRLALLAVGATWALSALISFLPVQLHWHKAPADATGRPASTGCDSSLNRAYAVSSSLVSFYIPVAVVLVTYARIYRIARGQIRRISSLERAARQARDRRGAGPPDRPARSGPRASVRRETEVLKTLAVVVGVFVGCWLPFFVLNCLAPFCGPRAGLPCVGEGTFDVFVWFGWANSALNPVVYAFNGEFRRAFAGLLGCGRAPSGSPGRTVRLSDRLLSCDRGPRGPGRAVAAYGDVLPDEAGHGDPGLRPSPTSAGSPGEPDGDVPPGDIAPFPPGGLRETPP
ncbi:D(1B) dopamine receptor [Ornithorhynchus anatinus]|uniref:D(1B) dopamine receptor n=1 Tax=Ornithorhynchus anatinus TaxID=9258 RepID=UPI0010A77523|nr:D(1B) dopamine receptor [Ornithorhynchus anatinus]